MADLNISIISDQASESNQAGWWHPLDSFQGVEYYGLCKEFGTTGRHQVEIVRRDADGTLTRGLCKNTDGTIAVFSNDVGHNQPSIVVDGEGYVHVFTSMHANLLRYFRSSSPGDVTEMVDATWNFPDVEWAWTYPIVGRAPNGDIYLMLRVSNRIATGETKRGAFVYKYSLSSHQWERFAHVAEQDAKSVYSQDIAVTSTGVHLLFEWAKALASGVRHGGAYGIIGFDGVMRDIAGVQAEMPVTQGQIAYKPIMPGENANTNSGEVMGLQCARFAFDSDGLSHIAYRYRDEDNIGGTAFGKFAVKLATWSGSEWVEEEIAYVPPDTGDTSATIATSLIDGKKRVWFSVEYTSGGSVVAIIVMAENDGTGWVYSVLGDSEPTLMRLSAVTVTDGNVLYVSAPFAGDGMGTVSRYFVPSDYSPVQGFSNFADLLAALG